MYPNNLTRLVSFWSLLNSELMEWSQLAGKIYAAELRPPEVEKCDQKWGPERSKNWNFGEKWEVGEVEKVENFQNFRKISKCSKNAPKVSTSIEKIMWVEKMLQRSFFGMNLDHIWCDLGGLEVKIGRSGRSTKVGFFFRKFLKNHEMSQKRTKGVN